MSVLRAFKRLFQPHGPELQELEVDIAKLLQEHQGCGCKLRRVGAVLFVCCKARGILVVYAKKNTIETLLCRRKQRHGLWSFNCVEGALHHVQRFVEGDFR